jgi:AraC-like DNA-binding protein
MHRLILHGLRRGNLAGLAVEEICLHLAAHVVASAHGVSRRHAGARQETTDRRHARLADEARQALAARFRERLRLEELAGAAGCSPYHLCRVFRREVGMTIHRYRSRLRLRAALEAVAGGARDLTGLALDLGFSDHSHFTNSFRREFGLPPSALRREETLRELLTLSKKLQA